MPKRLERKFTKPTQISKHLSCSICADVFIDATRLACGHTFCQTCIDKWNHASGTCPECRTPIDVQLMGKDLLAEKIIQDLEVACVNKLCDWKGRLAELNKHVKGCAYAKPPEWLTKFQSTQSFNEDDGPKDMSLIGNEEYEERVNQEVSGKSLLERLYTKSRESKELLDKKKETKPKGRGKKKEQPPVEKKLSLEFYENFLQSVLSEDDEQELSNSNSAEKEPNSDLVADESQNTTSTLTKLQMASLELQERDSNQHTPLTKSMIKEGKAIFESAGRDTAESSRLASENKESSEEAETGSKKKGRGRRKDRSDAGIVQTEFKKTKITVS